MLPTDIIAISIADFKSSQVPFYSQSVSIVTDYLVPVSFIGKHLCLVVPIASAFFISGLRLVTDIKSSHIFDGQRLHNFKESANFVLGMDKYLAVFLVFQLA